MICSIVSVPCAVKISQKNRIINDYHSAASFGALCIFLRSLPYGIYALTTHSD